MDEGKTRRASRPARPMPCEQPPGLPEELPDDPAALKAIIADLELSNAALREVLAVLKAGAPALTNAEAAGCASGSRRLRRRGHLRGHGHGPLHLLLPARRPDLALPRRRTGRRARSSGPSASTATRRGLPVRARGRVAPARPAGVGEGGAAAHARARAARVLRAQGALQLLRRRDRRARAQPAAEGGRHPRLLRRAPQRGVGQRRDRVPPARRRPQGAPVARRRPVRRQARRLGRRHQPRRAPHRVVPRMACATLGEEAPVAHTDRGCHYRWPGWKAICGRHGLARSMSRKGTSPDNAACEGSSAT